MTCDEAQELLLAREPLGWGRQQALDAHVRGCAACARLRGDLRVVRRAFATLPSSAELDPATRASIRGRIVARRRPRPALAAPAVGLALASLALVVLLLRAGAPAPARPAVPAAAVSAGAPSGAAAPPPSVPASPSVPAPAGAVSAPRVLPRPITLLVIGTDSPVDDPAGRADSLLLVRFDEAPARATIVALPRQLWARYPDGREGRLDTALAAGAQAGAPGAGAAFVRDAVAALLEVPVDYYLLVDMQGFVRLIDALGGVTVTIPAPLEDPAFPTADYGTTAVRFEAGPQLLSGERALTYARIRHGDGDFGRDGRQLLLLRGLLDDLARRGVLGQIDLVDDYRRLLSDSVRTDMPRDVLIAVARWSRGLDPAALDAETLEGAVDALPPPATFALDDAARARLRARLLAQPGQ